MVAPKHFTASQFRTTDLVFKMVESNVTYELFKTFKFGALQPERFQPMREEEKIRTNHL